MTLKLLLRTLTVVVVLCLGALGVELYRFETVGGVRQSLAAAEGAPGAVAGKFSPLAAPRPAAAGRLAHQWYETEVRF